MTKHALFIRGFKNRLKKIFSEYEELIETTFEVAAELPEDERDELLTKCGEINTEFDTKCLERVTAKAEELGLV